MQLNYNKLLLKISNNKKTKKQLSSVLLWLPILPNYQNATLRSFIPTGTNVQSLYCQKANKQLSNNQQVKTNIGNTFLKFTKNHKFNKIFNTNTIKISYCCTANMKNIIKQHNSKIQDKQEPDQTRDKVKLQKKIELSHG